MLGAGDTVHGCVIDDILLLWTHGLQKLKEFIAFINSQHPRIKFTFETSVDSGSVDYMDVTISISEAGEIRHKLFQKPCSSGLLIDFQSAVPGHIKLSVAKSQFIRACRLSSDAAMRGESETKITQQLQRNHYPAAFIDEARTSASKPRKQRKVNPHSAFLKLPYKSDRIHQTVNKLIRKYNIPTRVVYAHTGSLRNTRCSSALEPPPCIKTPTTKNRGRGRPRAPCMTCMSGGIRICMLKNVVYGLQCKVCIALCIGETGRALETRVVEHIGDARRRAVNSPWGHHFNTCHADVRLTIGESAFSSVRILARESDRARRKLREAVEIRAAQPQVNISSGWTLL